MTTFAHAVREELWSRGRRLESRLSHGSALQEHDGGIIATDARDDSFVARAEVLLERLRAAMPMDALVRVVAEAGTEGESSAMTVRIGPLSIVTDEEHVQDDLRLLRSARAMAAATATPHRPIVWRNGTAAILIHEAHGHPLEHGRPALGLPSWLHVDVPMRMRRATFRDVPLLRMEHVLVAQEGAPFEVPDEAVEVHMVDSGSYEPLTDTVTIRVSASTIGAFELVAGRRDLTFLGAEGEPQRYPGVICSREGQELVVGSFAPALVTGFR